MFEAPLLLDRFLPARFFSPVVILDPLPPFTSPTVALPLMSHPEQAGQVVGAGCGKLSQGAPCGLFGGVNLVRVPPR